MPMLTQVTIENPKNNKGLDLSDHHPIVIQNSGLKIVSYNLQFMPDMISVEGKKSKAEIKRAAQDFANYFANKDADVCCVQELFNNKADAILEQEMRKKGYVATKRVGGKLISALNGGVRIFVKKELESSLIGREYIYKNTIDLFVGGDALVNKGVVHSTFTKNNMTYHVFNTHLQAYYKNRDHYAEVTLAQCVEFKRYIENQKRLGLIGPKDKVILCGDINIPKSKQGENPNFLYERMEKLLGPQFKVLDYELNEQGPQYTRALNNSYNQNLEKSSDIDVNLDMAIEYLPENTCVDSELADIYSDIQLSMSKYVKKNATLISGWCLSDKEQKVLNKHTQQFDQLIQAAQVLKNENKNPLEDQAWFSQALSLLKGPGKENFIPAPNFIKAPEFKESSLTENLEPKMDLDTFEKCQQELDQLLVKFKIMERNMHKRYMYHPKKYENMYSFVIQMNHRLLNAKNEFYKNPNLNSLKKFQNISILELAEAENLFKQEKDFWEILHPQFKNLLGILAGLSVLPLLLVSSKTADLLAHTFFQPPSDADLAELKKAVEPQASNNTKI